MRKANWPGGFFQAVNYFWNLEVFSFFLSLFLTLTLWLHRVQFALPLFLSSAVSTSRNLLL